MASPSGDRIESRSPDSVYQLILSHFQGDLLERIDVQQMFILIDGVLPFEACLYYQVLPLFLDGSRLVLGMVSPEDSSATDYVRRIISYHNYLLVPRRISSEALQTTLSAYLNYAGTKSTSDPAQRSHHTRPHRTSARARAEQRIDHNAQPTLVVDSPEDLNLDDLEETPKPPPAYTPPPQIPFTPATPTELPTEPVGADAEVPFTTLQEPEQPPEPVSRDEQPPPAVPVPLMNPIPPLQIQLKHLNDPVEVLADLTPSEILQELLGRVLVGGIGRLYFERQPRYGRVLWSQNGVLQSVLDRLELPLFQGVLNELKLLAQLSLVPIDKPRQIEIERIYERSRLLLRFRFMPTANGEEATLQVLRGAALKFYQQQRLASLERDALSIARQLQNKLKEIHDRALSEGTPASNRLEVLPALSQILKNIEEHVDSLKPEDQDPPHPAP